MSEHESLAQTLKQLQAAINREDWETLGQLWAELPSDFRLSCSGRGIWAGMKRGIGEFDEAARIYFGLYKSEEILTICRMLFSPR